MYIQLVTGNFDTCYWELWGLVASSHQTKLFMWWSNFFLLLQRTSLFSEAQCGRLASLLFDVSDTCTLVQHSFHNDWVKLYMAALLNLGLFYHEEKLRV